MLPDSSGANSCSELHTGASHAYQFWGIQKLPSSRRPAVVVSAAVFWHRCGPWICRGPLGGVVRQAGRPGWGVSHAAAMCTPRDQMRKKQNNENTHCPAQHALQGGQAAPSLHLGYTQHRLRFRSGSAGAAAEMLGHRDSLPGVSLRIVSGTAQADSASFHSNSGCPLRLQNVAGCSSDSSSYQATAA